METIWFIILALMLTAYVVLDGFDLGAGILHLLVAKKDDERKVVLGAIGPVWDGNEVWLVVSGGVLFFAFPRAYAAAFSGFYLPLMMVLWLLIGRGISIEFRSREENRLWRSFWDGGFALASLLLAFVLGAALGNLVRGVPVDADGYFVGPLFTNFRPGPHPGVLDWYTMLVGLLAAGIIAGHGALYLIWKTAGPVRERSRQLAGPVWTGTLVLGLLATLATAHVRPQLYAALAARPWSWLLVALLVTSLALVFRFLRTQQELPAFLASAGFITGLLGATAAGMFPTILVSTSDPGFTLDAYNATTGALSLRVGLAAWVLAMLLAVGYFTLLFCSFRGKVGLEETSAIQEDDAMDNINGNRPTPAQENLPHVVIVGGGFGGLNAARALRGAPVRVTLLDRQNSHVFRPMLYQVATGILAANEIATPLRTLLRRSRNTEVLMAEVTGVDAERREVLMGEQRLGYDTLILATGVRENYFGHDDWKPVAAGLVSLGDAERIRARILGALEEAERVAAEEPADREQLQAFLTFVLVGAGPTGVEMAGSIADLARAVVGDEFRHVDPHSVRILLCEAGPRVLAAFPEALAEKARQRLEQMGVEVRTGAAVQQVDAGGVVVAGERIASRTVIWAAGVSAPSVGKWLGAETDRAGRVKVNPDLTVPGHPEVFVIGDTASLVAPVRSLFGGTSSQPRPIPGLAQPAIQGGRYVASVVKRRLRGLGAPKPFKYLDKGTMALVGRHFAIADLSVAQLWGWVAWWLWLGIHIVFVVGFANRLLVLTQWAMALLSRRRGVRTFSPEAPAPAEAAPGDRVAVPVAVEAKR